MAKKTAEAKAALTDKERREYMKRVHRKAIMFNNDEYKMIEAFCNRYGVKKRAKLFRETIMSAILQKMEQDHPKLF
jgi:hypothetical protein